MNAVLLLNPDARDVKGKGMSGETDGGTLRLRWSWQEVSAVASVITLLLGCLFAVFGRVLTAEHRIEQLEKRLTGLDTVPDRLSRLEVKIDILLDEREARKGGADK